MSETAGYDPDEDPSITRERALIEQTDNGPRPEDGEQPGPDDTPDLLPEEES